MAYYPESQIKTNLYAYPGTLIYKQTLEPYSGYYYAVSNGKFFSGKTPKNGPSIELMLEKPRTFNDNGSADNISSINPSLVQNPNFNVYSPKYSLEPFPSDVYKVEKVVYTSQNEEINSQVYLPIFYLNIPTQNDYEVGEYKRYFCKKSNEIIYIEISKNTYEKLIKRDPTILWQFYIPFKISWQLTGNKEQVYKVNRNIVMFTANKFKFPNLEDYLNNDYLKYYKETV